MFISYSNMIVPWAKFTRYYITTPYYRYQRCFLPIQMSGAHLKGDENNYKYIYICY